MSRPNVTDALVDGLSFARACVIDQRTASHMRKEHQWDDRYAAAMAAIDAIIGGHARSSKKTAKRAAKKTRRST